MRNSVWVVSDLHGHHDQMMRLVERCHKKGLNISQDTVIFLGDVVDGGGQTKQVIEQLIKWQKHNKNIIVLFGNHEDLLLDALVYNGKTYGSFDLWYQQGGKKTYESYLPSGLTQYEKAISQIKDHIPLKHLDWLNNLPLYYETDKYFFVHAGVLPNMSLKRHKEILKKRGSEAEDLKQQMVWIRDQFINSDYKWEKKIIFGHTAFPQPLIEDNKIGIDGMFHNKGQLVALELPDERFHFEKNSH